MDREQIMVKMVLDRWNALIKRCDTILSSLSDDQLMKEIVPGKNRGIYLLGHLIGVHDEMIPILSLGDRLYPELSKPFLELPDKAAGDIPSAQELRTLWDQQNKVLTQKLESLKPHEWFEKHNSISEEDFLKEPHRNKLNVMIIRVSHLSYHVGQLVLIK